MNIEIYSGDITEAKVDAIVNAANNHLWMGSGVAGAIKKKGGQIVEDDAMVQGPIEVGDAVATTAGNLPQKIVVHAAGMGQELKTNPELVYKSTLSSLKLADEMTAKSIAFPALGTGVGGLSLTECAQAMKRAVDEFAPSATNLTNIHFVIYGDDASNEFKTSYYT